MWHYIENPKVSIKKKKLKIVNKLNKIAGFKINMQKSVAFLYTYNKLSGRENKKTIPFKIISE